MSFRYTFPDLQSLTLEQRLSDEYLESGYHRDHGGHSWIGYWTSQAGQPFSIRNLPIPSRCCYIWPKAHHCFKHCLLCLEGVGGHRNYDRSTARTPYPQAAITLPWIPPGECLPGSDITIAVHALMDEVSDQLKSSVRESSRSDASRLSTPTILNLSAYSNFDLSSNNPIRSFGLSSGSRGRSIQCPANQSTPQTLEDLPVEIILMIMKYLPAFDLISLGLVSVKLHECVPDEVYREAAVVHTSNVRVNGIQIEILAKAWSSTKKGITWYTPIDQDTIYCWAERVGLEYRLYVHCRHQSSKIRSFLRSIARRRE